MRKAAKEKEKSGDDDAKDVSPETKLREAAASWAASQKSAQAPPPAAASHKPPPADALYGNYHQPLPPFNSTPVPPGGMHMQLPPAYSYDDYYYGYPNYPHPPSHALPPPFYQQPHPNSFTPPPPPGPPPPAEEDTTRKRRKKKRQAMSDVTVMSPPLPSEIPIPAAPKPVEETTVPLPPPTPVEPPAPLPAAPDEPTAAGDTANSLEPAKSDKVTTEPEAVVARPVVETVIGVKKRASRFDQKERIPNTIVTTGFNKGVLSPRKPLVTGLSTQSTVAKPVKISFSIKVSSSRLTVTVHIRMFLHRVYKHNVTVMFITYKFVVYLTIYVYNI